MHYTLICIYVCVYIYIYNLIVDYRYLKLEEFQWYTMRPVHVSSSHMEVYAICVGSTL